MTCPHNVYRTEVQKAHRGALRHKVCVACGVVFTSEYVGPFAPLPSPMDELEARIRRLEEAVYGPK